MLVRAVALGLTTIASTLFSEVTPEFVAAAVAAVEGILQVFVKDQPTDMCPYCDEPEEANA